MLAAFALVIVATVVLIAARNPIVRMALPHVLGRVLQAEVEVGRVAIGLDGEIVIETLRLADPGPRARVRGLEVDLIRARVDYLGLLGDPIGAVESLTIEAPLLEIEPSRRPPADPEVKKKPVELPALLPELSIRFGRVVVRRPNGSIEIRNLELRSTKSPAVTPPGSTVGVNADYVIAATDAVREGSCTIDARYRDGILDIERADLLDGLRLTSGRVDLAAVSGTFDIECAGGSGSVDFGPRTDEMPVALRVTGLMLDEAREMLGLTKPSIHGTLTATVTGAIVLADPWSSGIRAEADVETTDQGPLSPFQASFAGRYENGSARIERMRASGRGFSLQSTSLSARIRTPDGDFAGTDAILSDLTGLVAVEAEDLSRIVEVVSTDPRLRRLTDQARLDAVLRLSGQTANLVTGKIQSPLVQLDLDRATARFGSGLDFTFDIGGTMTVPELSDIATQFDLDRFEIGGGVTAQLAATGSRQRQDATLTLEADRLSVLATPIGTLRAAVVVEPGRVRIDECTITPGEDGLARVEASGGLDVNAAMLDDVRLSIAGERIAPRLGALLDRAAAAGLTPAEAAARTIERLEIPVGSTRLTARLTGPLSFPDGDLSCRHDTADDGPVTTIELTKDGESIGLDAEQVPVRDALLSLAARGRLTPAFDEGELTVESLDIRREDERWSSVSESTARFRRADAFISLEPALEMRGGSDSIRISVLTDDSAGTAETVIHADGSFADLLPLRLADRPVEVRDLRFDLKARAGRSLLQPGDALIPRSIQLEASARSLRTRGISGAFESTFRLENQPGSPQSAAADFRIDDLQIAETFGGEPLDETLAGAVDCRLSWDGNLIRIDRLEANVDEVRFEGSGTAEYAVDLERLARGEGTPVPGAIDAQVTANLDHLARWRSFFPDLRRIDGAASLKATITGTGAAPNVAGILELRQAELAYADNPPLDSLDARIVMTPDLVRIDSFSGESAGGPFRIEGHIDQPFRAPELHLRINGDDVLLARDQSVRLRGAPDIVVEGPLERMRVSGQLEITEGRYREDVALVDITNMLRSVGRLTDFGSRGSSTSAARGSDSFALPSLGQGSMADLQLDVEVRSREPLELLGNVARGRIRPEVRLLGTGTIPYMVGSVFLDDFRISLPATTLRTEFGVIRFDEKAPLYPEIEILARTRMIGIDITVSVTGRFNEPTVTLSSSPPLPASDLLVLITTGRPPVAEGTDSVAQNRQAMLTVAQFLASDLIRQIFGSNSLDSEESIIERFEVEAGRDISRNGRETFEARFRLYDNIFSQRDYLYLTGERDRYEHYNIGLRIVIHGR